MSLSRTQREVPTSLAQQYRLEHDYAHGQHPRQQPFVLAYRMHGQLSLEHLQAALDRIIQMHPALQTVFPDQSVDIAVVSPSAGWPITRLPASTDLSDISHAIWDSPWSFEEGPLLRAFVTDGPEPLLALIIEHLVFDMVSIEQLIQSLADAYRAISSGSGAPASPERASYFDLAAAERTRAESDRASVVSRFWNEHWGCSPAYPVTHLRADGPRPGLYQSPAVWIDRKLPEAAARLWLAARRARTTPFVLGLTALALTERALADGGRVGAMFATANRLAKHSATVVGFFANPVCCYLDLPQGSDPRQSVRAVHDTVMAAVEHQDMVTPAVIRRTRPNEDHLGLDIPHVFFDFRDPSALPTPAIEGVELAPVDSQPYHSWRLYPGINVSVVTLGDDACLRVHFAPDVYRVETIDRYIEMLSSSVEDLLTAIG